LATVNSYHSAEWQGRWLFGFPFYAIIKGTLTEPAPLSNLVLSFGWIFLVLMAIVVMIRNESLEVQSHASGGDSVSNSLSVVPLHIQLSALSAG